jgi:AcrR family transcriptional regulator
MITGLRNHSEDETTKRISKRDAILQEGAALLNNQGAGGINLGELSNTVGLSRNALYYYVKDRGDLVRQCYLNTCNLIESDLNAANAVGKDARGKIECFVARTLDPGRSQTAVLADVDVLETPYSEEVQARCDAHVRGLEQIIIEGQASGQFRSLDPQIAANTLLGMLNWTALWVRNWADEDADVASKLNASSAAIRTMFLDGLVPANSEPFNCLVEFENLPQVRLNVFDRSDARLLRQTQLIETASLLFNRRGLDGTTIDQIGEATGTSKSAVYRQFQDKTSLINQCYESALEQYETIWRVAEDKCSDPVEILLTTFHLNCQAQASQRPPLILQSGLSNLSKRYIDRANLLGRRALVHARAAYKNRSIRFQSRELSDVTAGAFFWIQKWRETRPELSSVTIADEMTDIVRSGICTELKHKAKS